MRTDYIFYIIAVLCLILAIVAQVVNWAAPTSTIILVILMIIFAVAGYYTRPKTGAAPVKK
jgi:membrane protein YdbS with pleckstrin-like domain